MTHKGNRDSWVTLSGEWDVNIDRVGVFIVGWGCFCLLAGYFLSFAQHYRYKFRKSRKPNPGQESSIGVLPGRKENRAKDLRILQENNQSDESCSLYVPNNTNFGLNTPAI